MKIDAVRKLVKQMSADGIGRLEAQALVKKIAGKDGSLNRAEANQLKAVIKEFKDSFTPDGARELSSALKNRSAGAATPAATGRAAGAYGRAPARTGGSTPARTGGAYSRGGGTAPARTGGTTPARTGGSYGRSGGSNVVDWSSPGRRTSGNYR